MMAFSRELVHDYKKHTTTFKDGMKQICGSNCGRIIYIRSLWWSLMLLDCLKSQCSKLEQMASRIPKEVLLPTNYAKPNLHKVLWPILWQILIFCKIRIDNSCSIKQLQRQLLSRLVVALSEVIQYYDSSCTSTDCYFKIATNLRNLMH